MLGFIYLKFDFIQDSVYFRVQFDVFHCTIVCTVYMSSNCKRYFRTYLVYNHNQKVIKTIIHMDTEVVLLYCRQWVSNKN